MLFLVIDLGSCSGFISDLLHLDHVFFRSVLGVLFEGGVAEVGQKVLDLLPLLQQVRFIDSVKFFILFILLHQ